MRELGGTPHGEPALAELGHHAPGLHRHPGVATHLVASRDGHRTFERGVGFRIVHGEVDHQVVWPLGVEKRRAGGERVVRGRHRIERVEMDVQQVAGVLGPVPVVRDHHRDGRAHVADLPPGEGEHPDGTGVLVEVGERGDVIHVRSRERPEHAGDVSGVPDAYCFDQCMGKRAPVEGGLEHAGQRYIGCEASPSRQQAVILDPGHLSADVGGPGGHRGRSQAAITASTIPSYPVHRHRLPASNSRMLPSSG